MKKKALLAQIYLAGTSPAEIAVELDVSRQAVSAVINNKGWSQSIARHISSQVGKPVSSLWPGRSDKRRKAAR
ncbi:hypothetical protein [Hydrocarboniphaga effusa]|uniref:hypothetical protein n=1 Tax=Hydrocarboniphaga effusa TaxID=243629 RepID=UPI003BACFFE7